ncbi:hypothetical protein [uncultured Enterococcus sp.]|uniref:hypothetical protein n=1 Tax=uncultured Enterococcus sp. TaxID=167972 RepID=UPI002AA88BB6|nr:hypothetical protein [uncultured Enterococcus sp.]
MEQIKKLLKENRIKEVYLVGFVDEVNGVFEFCPDLRFLYFEFAEGIVECRSVEQCSRLQLKIVDSIRHDFEIDEDMFAATSRAGELILDNPELLTNEIARLTAYGLKQADGEMNCLALEMQLKSGQFIFIDPTFLHGISVGSHNQKKLWKENLLDRLAVEASECSVF